jgi:hypothetical protein
MISMIAPLAAGNALRVFLEPPPFARRWRLLRKLSDSFTGQDDPDAVVVHDGGDKPVLDIAGLVNGTLYFYRPFYSDGVAWSSAQAVSATPAATYEGVGSDVLSLVRDRLDLGLQEELRRGTLLQDEGHIQVLTAPPLTENTVWPIVTVHLQGDDPADRALGEAIGADEFDAIGGDWGDTEGWLSRVQLALMGWSLNPDERIELRRALKRIVQANLPVFADAGMTGVEFSMQDTEDFSSYDAPVYQVLCTFSCLAPSVVTWRVPAVSDVIQFIQE